MDVDLVRETPGAPADRHDGVSIEIGAASNPPGFDDQLIGMTIGEEKRFPLLYPDDYSITELQGKTANYVVMLKGIKKRVVPDLDDEFARDLGEFEDLEALRTRVRAGFDGRGRARRRARSA